MYAVVGCGECTALWIVEGHPESSECPRCGTRRPYDRRKQFYTAEDADAAREARAQLLAQRQDDEAAFASVDSFAELDDRVEAAAVDDETYLEASGLDADAVAAAGRRAGESDRTRQSNEAVVRAALNELEAPTTEAVTDYATARGVEAGTATRLLEKLVRAGEVSESRGTYRLL